MLKSKIIAISLSVAIILSFASGCSSAPVMSETTKSSTSAGETTKTQDDKAPAEGGKLFEETFEFSIMAAIWEPHSKATEDMSLFNEIAKRTNTKIDYQWFPIDGYTDRLTTTLASGKIPDAINPRDGLSMLIEQDALVPLDDYLKTSGQNILKSYESVQSVMKNPNDGKTYAFPFVLDYPPSYAMLVRKDWLDACGITKTPETWDEWVAAWTAFKENDANGDGDKTNDIPYGGDIYTLLPAFGLQVADKKGFVVKDGEYSIMYEQPEFKAFLESMKDLHSKGLLDNEFATRGTFVNQKEFEKALFAGIVGSAFTWAEMAKRTTESVRGIKPDALMIGVPAIKGPEGKSGIPARGKASINTVVTIAAEKSGKVESIVKYYNWLFGEEGAKLASYGIEGTHYDMVDNKPILKEPYVTSFVEARGAGLNFTPLSHMFLPDAYEQILLAGKTYETADESTKLFYDALKVGGDDFYAAPQTLNTNAYTEKQAQIFPKLETLVAECVIGKLTVDQFYAEYEKLKPVGLEEILKQGKEAWDKMK